VPQVSVRFGQYAFCTAPILAGVIREDLGGAFVAAPQMSAESLGAAGKDIGDGGIDHGGAAASEVGHRLIEDLSQRNAGWLGQVGVDGGVGDIGVTEQTRVILRLNLRH
jgi:hypothetical protein